MTMLSPSEDLRDWVVDNWFTVEDCIGFALQTMIVDSKKDILNDVVDREDTVEFISERVKEGILWGQNTGLELMRRGLSLCRQ